MPHRTSQAARRGAAPRPDTSDDAPEAVGNSAERTYEAVKSMAITYQFRPGERINEVALAKRLNVSRTPVREALNRLVAAGFLTSVPNRGFYSRPLDPREIFDLYELRAVLEGAVVRLVCARATDEELQELRQFVESTQPIRNTREPSEILRLDEAFHIRLAQLTRNSEMVRALEGINTRIHFTRWVDLQRNQVPKQHLKMVDLLMTRNADACERTMREQISRRYEDIVEVLRDVAAEIFVQPGRR